MLPFKACSNDASRCSFLPPLGQGRDRHSIRFTMGEYADSNHGLGLLLMVKWTDQG